MSLVSKIKSRSLISLVVVVFIVIAGLIVRYQDNLTSTSTVASCEAPPIPKSLEAKLSNPTILSAISEGSENFESVSGQVEDLLNAYVVDRNFDELELILYQLAHQYGCDNSFPTREVIESVDSVATNRTNNNLFGEALNLNDTYLRITAQHENKTLYYEILLYRSWYLQRAGSSPMADDNLLTEALTLIDQVIEHKQSEHEQITTQLARLDEQHDELFASKQFDKLLELITERRSFELESMDRLSSSYDIGHALWIKTTILTKLGSIELALSTLKNAAEESTTASERLRNYGQIAGLAAKTGDIETWKFALKRALRAARSQDEEWNYPGNVLTTLDQTYLNHSYWASEATKLIRLPVTSITNPRHKKNLVWFLKTAGTHFLRQGDLKTVTDILEKIDEIKDEGHFTMEQEIDFIVSVDLPTKLIGNRQGESFARLLEIAKATYEYETPSDQDISNFQTIFSSFSLYGRASEIMPITNTFIDKIPIDQKATVSYILLLSNLGKYIFNAGEQELGLRFLRKSARLSKEKDFPGYELVSVMTNLSHAYKELEMYQEFEIVSSTLLEKLINKIDASPRSSQANVLFALEHCEALIFHYVSTNYNVQLLRKYINIARTLFSQINFDQIPAAPPSMNMEKFQHSSELELIWLDLIEMAVDKANYRGPDPTVLLDRLNALKDKLRAGRSLYLAGLLALALGDFDAAKWFWTLATKTNMKDSGHNALAMLSLVAKDYDNIIRILTDGANSDSQEDTLLTAIWNSKSQRTSYTDDVAKAFLMAQRNHDVGLISNSLKETLARSLSTQPELVQHHRFLERQKANLEFVLDTYLSDNQNELKIATSIQDQILEIGKELATSETRLRNVEPEYWNLVHSSPPSMSTVQTLLEDNEALVFFRLYENDPFDLNLKTLPGVQKIEDSVYPGFVWVITSEEITLQPLPQSAKYELPEMIYELRSTLDKSVATIGDISHYDTQLAHQLYQTVLGDVAGSITDKSRLIVVPSGVLFSLPFAALVTKHPETTPETFEDYREISWLANKYAISIMPSVQALVAARSVRHRQSTHQTFFGIGNPKLVGNSVAEGLGSIASIFKGSLEVDVDAINRLPRLPQSRQELELLSNVFGEEQSTIFSGKEATETNLKALDLTQFRTIAFSTHALVTGQLKGLEEPALVLTPPKKPSDLDDGLLVSSEVMELQLNADLIILSACRTAADDGTAYAKPLSGLAHAFMYAGAKALLVTHWAAESEASSRLTTKFGYYSTLPGIDASVALKKARQDLIYSDEPMYAHPMFWAVFFLVGDIGGSTEP